YFTPREPLGVVGIITPWNFPLAIPMWKTAPALVYGNTVVLKPAELASLTAYRMWELIASLFPAGVVNLVLGLGSVAGEALIQHPLIQGVSFTGSTGVGQHIAETAVSRGVKYQLEMGGKNPVIVADDADLDLAVELTVSGAMRSAGQKCTATSRVILMEGIRQEFTDRLVNRVQALQQGDPAQPETYLGPVVSQAQYDKVMGLIDRGRTEGGRVLTGGTPVGGPLARGYFVPPTVFDGVAAGATIAQEEIFGPVIALIPVKTVDEAIEVANDVRYGLSASVFTRNLKTAMACVEGIEAGLVRVNEETAGVELQAPFGGVKASSSHSREQGRAAIEFYTHTKTVAIRPS
ncbi:MAG: aldehyde dehydrogenase family protein, partial [Firmicutes bacterium]|nr:aldehyde dehydrogenase family protein [Bacillota bacterium]